MRPSALRTGSLSANAEPQTSTKAICMEKDNKLQTPLPQWVTTSTGELPNPKMEAAKATKVKRMAKIKGSGR